MSVWRKGNIERKLCVKVVVCTIIMVQKGTSSSYRSLDCIGLAQSYEDCWIIIADYYHMTNCMQVSICLLVSLNVSR